MNKSKNVEYYQITRDGFARVGKLKIEEKEKEWTKEWITPTVIEFDTIKDVVENTFVPMDLSIIDNKRFLKLRKEDKNFTILNFNFNAYKLIKILKVKSKISEKPIYMPAIATPVRIPLLSYFGCDVFDTIPAEIMAEKGIFMHFYGNFKAKSLKCSDICNCKICSEYGNEVIKDFELLKQHNIEIMRIQAKITREMIKKGELRNFVEAIVKHEPELVAALRLADNNGLYGKFQRFKKSKAKFCTQESFTRPEVNYFLNRMTEIYNPATNFAVVLPCSAKKPYLLSKTHKTIRRCISGVNEIIVSSPLVSPRELELCYPVINYDVPVTGDWSKDEIDFVAENLSKLLVKFDHVVSYLSGGYKKVFEKACNIAGIDGITANNLDELKEIVKSIKNKEYINKNKVRLYNEMFKHIMAYQFNIIPEFEVKVKGRYPELSFFLKHKNEHTMFAKRFARIDTLRGMLDLYDPKFLIDNKKYTVEIDNFIPKGTIFAAGVLSADERILPGDLVAFKNNECIGIGISKMSGEEMVEFSKGCAIDVKRVVKHN